MSTLTTEILLRELSKSDTVLIESESVQGNKKYFSVHVDSSSILKNSMNVITISAAGSLIENKPFFDLKQAISYYNSL